MDDAQLDALERAIRRAEHHLAETRQNWHPGIAQAEADVAALTRLRGIVAAVEALRDDLRVRLDDVTDAWKKVADELSRALRGTPRE